MVGMKITVEQLCASGDPTTALDLIQARDPAIPIRVDELDQILDTAGRIEDKNSFKRAAKLRAQVGGIPTDALIKLAQNLTDQGFSEDALSLLNELKGPEADRFGVLQTKMRIMRRLKQSDQELEIARRLTVLFPYSSKAWFLLASVHRTRADLPAEEEALLNALKFALKDEVILERLSHVAAERSLHRVSLSRWEQLLRLSPNNEQALLGNLRQLIRLKRFSAAQAYVEEHAGDLPKGPELNKLLELAGQAVTQ